jgi:hypothetical protein
MCLGSNDVSKCKDDSDQVNVLLTQAISKVKSYFPDYLIGICGILPRKGTGNNTNILNATTTSVNNFIRKLCMKDQTVEYIDRYNYSIAFAMLVSVYMRRMGGWFAYSVSIEFGYCLRIT